MKFDSTSDKFQSWLTSLPPDVLQQVLQGGTLDQSDKMLEGQMAQAQQLRMERAGDHPYGAGAGIAGGIGGALQGIQQAMLQHRQQGNIDKRQASIEALVKALREGKSSGATLTPPSMLQAPPDQSFSQSLGVQPGDYAGTFDGGADQQSADAGAGAGGAPFTPSIKKTINTKPIDQMNPLEIEQLLNGQ